MSLRHLPYEIVFYITQQMNLEDVYNLSLCCRQFQYLAREENICKAVLESTAPSAPETQEARLTKRYASALRRLAKRREAIQSAKPYMVAAVAVAESHLYVNGNLCYIADWSLRILDLHNSSRYEDVVDILTLLDAAIEPPVNTEKDTFQLLHYSHGIVSCLYSRKKNQELSWLVAFNPNENRILTALPLDSTWRIFVRNDANYLYFGTHSEYGDDGYRRWVLQGYCFHDEKWFDQKVHLLDMVGSDIGGSITFEIIDGYFYGISNQNSFEVEEIDWTSYYNCFRFPVDQPQPKKTEVSVKDAMWRRQHGEGPIDDRWSFLKLEKDEKTSLLRIVESRKEWPSGQSSGKRTYYMTDVVFPATPDANPGGEGSSGHRVDIGNAPPESFSVPTKEEAHIRNPFYMHIGDDSASQVMFTFSKCPIRSYHSTCQTFLDLVDDPLASDPNTQRLRLRAGSRRLRPTEDLKEKLHLDVAFSKIHESRLPTEEQIRRLYRDDGENHVVFFPSEEEANNNPEYYEELNKLLNPPTHLGNVHGTCDDRSLVYATGGMQDGIQVLVFVSFDPAIHLLGLREYGGRPTPMPQFPAPQSETSVEGKGKGRATDQTPAVAFGEKGSETTADGFSNLGKTPEKIFGECASEWTRKEPALYLSLAWGYNFAL